MTFTSPGLLHCTLHISVPTLDASSHEMAPRCFRSIPFQGNELPLTPRTLRLHATSTTMMPLECMHANDIRDNNTTLSRQPQRWRKRRTANAERRTNGERRTATNDKRRTAANDERRPNDKRRTTTNDDEQQRRRQRTDPPTHNIQKSA